VTIDSVTAVQYSGYFEDTIRKFLKRTEVVPESEEARVQRVLDEERKRIQRIVGARGKVMQHNEPRGYDINERLIRFYESGELGKKIDTFA